jgi:hypothetical protein
VASVWYMLLGLEVAAALWYLHNGSGTRSVWLMASLLGWRPGLAGCIEGMAQWSGSRPMAAQWRNWWCR